MSAPPRPRILLVEDDLALRTGLTDALAEAGYAVRAEALGTDGQAALDSDTFDLVVLDLMLPLKGGLEILRDLRARGDDTLVLILTARGDENDRVLGLELGADDYVTKPFSLRELLARVAVLLRRRRTAGDAGAGDRVIRIGPLEVDLAAFEVRDGATSIPLSPKEVAMLQLLHQEAGRVVSRHRFMSEVWEGSEMVGPRTVDTHVLNLRQKIEADPKAPRYLVTVHGAGYRLDLEGRAP